MIYTFCYSSMQRDLQILLEYDYFLVELNHLIPLKIFRRGERVDFMPQRLKNHIHIF